METQILLSVLLKIFLIMLMGGICALFSYLLDYCFWAGSIFENYLPWLGKYLLKAHFREEYEEVLLLPKETQADNFITRANKIFLFKVLGGCIVCCNVWISMSSFILIQFFSQFQNIHFNWFYAFPYILTSSFILRKSIKH